METVSDLLSSDPLSSFSKQADKYRVSERFGNLLEAPSGRLLGALAPFVLRKPFRYWDREEMAGAINILEEDAARSLRALSERASAIDRGLAAFYRPSSTSGTEDPLSLNQPRDLIDIASIYLPDYLRWCEHVFGNLLEMYWAVLKRGDVKGAFILKGAAARITSTGNGFLLNGYSEGVRNAIAHGNVSLSPFEIEFGHSHPETLTASEFLRLYDDLVRTCNAMVSAILIFWSRHQEDLDKTIAIPTNVLVRLAAGGFDREGLRLIGAIESDTPRAGRQLHVAIEISVRKRAQVLGECARVAYHLQSVGAKGFDRYVIQVDQGEAVGSMVTIDPSVLSELIAEDAPFQQLSHALGDTNLLWFDESTWATRWKSWREIVSSGMRWLQIDVLSRWHKAGIFLGRGRYIIRDVENLGSGGVSRVKVRAVLRNPQWSDNSEIVRAILVDIVAKFRWKLLRSRSQILDEGIQVPKFPSYIWVDLFREDGRLRWLKSGGWMAGNIVAVAEFARRANPPVLIEQPEEVHRGIRIRYSMNEKRAAEALFDIRNILRDIWDDNAHDKNQ